MKIGRFVSDLGNSTSQFMMFGNYFEMPSSCTEISKFQAEGLFSGKVELEDLKNQLALRFNDQYFKVGQKAQDDVFGDDHINDLHDKTESVKTLINWLAAVAFYHAYQFPEMTEDDVEIEYSSTLLPVWLLKRAPKFKMMLEKMANRFKGELGEVELLTPGFERVLHIKTQISKCRIEGETARFGLKRSLDLQPLAEASQYDDSIAIVNDLGGQTHDLSKLKPGLKRPGNSNDFKSYTDQTYMKFLDDLRKNKLMTHFRDLRTLETFIKDHVLTRKYVFENAMTGEKTDFTNEIDLALKQFARIVVENAMKAFEIPSGEKLKFIWIGGVAQLLKEYISEYIANRYGEERLRETHIFPENARMLNIYGLEIVAKNETLEVKSGDVQTPTP